MAKTPPTPDGDHGLGRDIAATASPPRGGARSALLDAAHELVRRQGWAATSVDDLCAAAGVTKGAFFHHFASKEEFGIAAAEHWAAVTAPLFAAAEFNHRPDPVDRILGYLDFRAEISDQQPLEAFTCFAGTTVQEVFATSDAIRAACGSAIRGHADWVAGLFRAALEAHGVDVRAGDAPLTAESLGLYTQTVLQGGFVLSKASGDRTPLVEAVAHLKLYVSLLFGRPAPPESDH